MFETTIAGSLPKPGWLAETNKLWPEWRAQGDELARAKRDATLLWLKEQEDAGLDIVSDGEQSRQHFVHGFLEFVEGIDFEHKVKMGIRNNRYDAMVPIVIGPLRLKGRVHQAEATLARAHILDQARAGEVVVLEQAPAESRDSRVALGTHHSPLPQHAAHRRSGALGGPSGHSG